MRYRCPHCCGEAKPIKGAEETIKCEGAVHCQFMGDESEFEHHEDPVLPVDSQTAGYVDELENIRIKYDELVYNKYAINTQAKLGMKLH